MVCPLCNQKDYLTLRQDKLKNLSKQWQRQFGFDPFSEAFLGETIDKLACVECGLIYFSPAYFGDATFYSKLSQHEWYYESDKWEFDQAIALVQKFKPKSILEVGCGAGEFLQKISLGVNYYLGLDFNEAALTSARQKGLNVRNENIKDLKDSFDMIVLFEVLEHLESPYEILKAIESKLNPEGILLLAVPNPDGYLKDMGVVLLDMPPHHNTAWKKETFDFLANKLGMQILSYETEPLRYVHFQSLISTLIQHGSKSFFIKKVQQVLARLLTPFLFTIGSHKFVGQTHLVTLKKPLVKFHS